LGNGAGNQSADSRAASQSGQTLLRVSGEPSKAAAVLREGLGADPANAELYSGLDQALSLLRRPAAERVEVFRKYPDAATMPARWSTAWRCRSPKPARFDDAEKLFHGRFFPREEGGTNVRQVYLEVKLQQALAAAKAGRSSEALQNVSQLGKPVPGLDFTRDGFEPLLAGARVQILVARIEKAAGRPADAERRLRELLAGTSKGRGAAQVYVYLAARELGDASQADLRARMCRALEPGSGVSTASGAGSLVRGLILGNCGRTADARRDA
jgi:predicted Zn-dependent protease